jgi:hypothetical protein
MQLDETLVLTGPTSHPTLFPPTSSLTPALTPSPADPQKLTTPLTVVGSQSSPSHTTTSFLRPPSPLTSLSRPISNTRYCHAPWNTSPPQQFGTSRMCTPRLTAPRTARNSQFGHAARLCGNKGAQTSISPSQSPCRSADSRRRAPWDVPPPWAKVLGSQTELLTPWYDGRA